ncbi:hypothetical protein [Lutibacter citreus]|uniref:hypothetical protein n=1 Tax=Lutibacter citreus TaxID=2138210 RepID=UPI000DBE0699|nr:hypothetical protein [Lutibacter citreus]
MAFSISKLFKSKTPTIVNLETLDKLDFQGGTKYALNESNIAYVDIEELGGFPYLKTIIIGDTSVKIKRIGCTLSFNFNKNDILKLNSDNTDIESNKIKGTNIYYTEIDFELNESEADKIKTIKVETILFNLNTLSLPLKTI